MSSPHKIAVLGAGPIGLEVALFAQSRDFEVTVFEKDVPGSNILKWGHIELFSPWEMNRSAWGENALADLDVELEPADAYPTGREFVDRYVRPLAEHPSISDRIETGTTVVGVTREHALKGDFIGDPARASAPFLLRVRDRGGERYERADIVIDTTGVYDQPRALGPGGMPAIGEADLADQIERHIPDVLGTERTKYAGESTLLVGAGYSAVTTARLLAELHEDAPDTRVDWLLSDDQPPYKPSADDPLPQRKELGEFGNEAALGRIDGVEPIHGRLWRLADSDAGIEAEIRDGDESTELMIENVVGNTGYRPDTELYRELQVHLCYATEGLMDLSAHLLAQSGAAGDCLDQETGGFDTLTSPEPDFYVLGSKSYGRNSDFLLRLGHEQIEELFDGLDG